LENQGQRKRNLVSDLPLSKTHFLLQVINLQIAGQDKRQKTNPIGCEWHPRYGLKLPILQPPLVAPAMMTSIPLHIINADIQKRCTTVQGTPASHKTKTGEI
jgi:hypothetical protein